MRFWKWMDRIEGGMASVGAGICLLSMMIMTVVSVVGRYVLHQDILPGVYNLIERVAFPLIVFWAVPLAHREGTFPRFETVVEALPASLRRLVHAFVLIVELGVYLVLMYYVLRYTWSSIDIGRTIQIGVDVWPVWPILIMVPISFALMMLEMLRLTWNGIAGAGDSTPAPNSAIHAVSGQPSHLPNS